MLGNCVLLYRVHNVQIEAVGRDCTFVRDTTKHNSLTFFNVRITINRKWDFRLRENIPANRKWKFRLRENIPANRKWKFRLRENIPANRKWKFRLNCQSWIMYTYCWIMYTYALYRLNMGQREIAHEDIKRS